MILQIVFILQIFWRQGFRESMKFDERFWSNSTSIYTSLNFTTLLEVVFHWNLNFAISLMANLLNMTYVIIIVLGISQ